MASTPPNDGWIEWKGGECPVDPDLRVQVRFRDGEKSSANRTAGWWHGAGYDAPETSNWIHDGGEADIIAYRVQP